MASPEPNPTYGPQNLKTLRIAAGTSRRELVDELAARGVPMNQTSLRRLEEGDQIMKASEAVAFADYFGKELDEFLRAPLDPLGAELTTMSRELLADADGVYDAAALAVAEYDELAYRLKADDIPPAEQSSAVREALAVLDSVKPLYEPFEQLQDLISALLRRRNVGDGQG